MKVLLFFKCYINNYVIYELDNKIYIGKLENNVVIKPKEEEKDKLGYIIKILIQRDFEISSLLNCGFILENKENFKYEINDNTGLWLQFSYDNEGNMKKNCNFLYLYSNDLKETKNKGKKIKVILIIFLLMLLIGFLTFILINRNNDKQFENGNNSHENENDDNNSEKQYKRELLKKYTMEGNELFESMKDLKYEFINIKYKETNDENIIIKNELAYFKNIFDVNYTLNKKNNLMDESTIFLYTTDNQNLNLTVMNMKNTYPDYTEQVLEHDNSLEDLIENGYTEIDDLYKIYKRNNVNNAMDLYYAVLKNINKTVNENSSKNEILDKFVFDYLRSIVLVNRDTYFFTGDQYGYAVVSDKQSVIQLKNKNDEFRILVSFKLTKEQCTEIVQSIKFNY